MRHGHKTRQIWLLGLANRTFMHFASTAAHHWRRCVAVWGSHAIGSHSHAIGSHLHAIGSHSHVTVVGFTVASGRLALRALNCWGTWTFASERAWKKDFQLLKFMYSSWSKLSKNTFKQSKHNLIDSLSYCFLNIYISKYIQVQLGINPIFSF